MNFLKHLAILGVLPLLCACLFTPEPFDEEKWHRDVLSSNAADLYASHFQDGVFFNPWMVRNEDRFMEFLKWQLLPGGIYSQEEESFKPQSQPDLLRRIQAVPEKTDFLVWIGHATFLLRLDGTYWLTDPMLSDRALLPKRITAPALTKLELDRLEGAINVVISHNHYDHLDTSTIEALPSKAHIFVPLGLRDFVGKYFPGKVTEMDWWQRVEVDGTVLTSLPAQHWSRRIGQGVNTTLWASFMIEAKNRIIYYGGDSGYFIGYKEFSQKFPPIDIALLPTTAYHPRWFMHYAHMNIAEALNAFNELQARFFVPTQWGTFHLGDNPPGLPRLELDRAIRRMNLDEKRFIRPQLGEIVVLEKHP